MYIKDIVRSECMCVHEGEEFSSNSLTLNFVKFVTVYYSELVVLPTDFILC